MVVLMVMLAESVFGCFCIVQCVINFSSSSFVGTDRACDFQGFYATYYTIASLALTAYVIVVGSRVLITQGRCTFFRPAPLLVSGLAIHVVALILASLPLMGAGSFLFAHDYCTLNTEDSVYAGIFTSFFVAALLAIAIATGMAIRYSPTSDLDRSARRLLVGSAIYFMLAWITSLVIVFLWLANGKVLESDQWRVYGAQAIILHSNQLVIPVIFGYVFRHTMHAIIASDKKATGGDGPKIAKEEPGVVDEVSVMLKE